MRSVNHLSKKGQAVVEYILATCFMTVIAIMVYNYIGVGLQGAFKDAVKVILGVYN